MFVFLFLALGIFLTGSVLFLIFDRSWWPRPYGFFEGIGKGPDATTLISTLVVVYTFFIAAYGALTPLVVGKRKSLTWKLIKEGGVASFRVSVLGLMALAVGLDLFRIGNSVGDLYATTMRYLRPSKVFDAASEFTSYLILNSAVLLFALIVACLPERPVGHAESAAKN